MKLTYIAHTNLPPHDWAHSLQILNMSKAFSEEGANVTLLVPHRRLSEPDVPLHYATNSNLVIHLLPCIDLFPGSPRPLFYWLRFFSFYVSAYFYILTHRTDAIYTRDLYATIFFKNFIFEMHDFPKTSFLLKKLISRAGMIFVTNEWKKNELCRDYPSYSHKFYVARNAIHQSDLSEDLNLPVAPKELYSIGYFGSLKTKGMDKGISTAFEALKNLPSSFFLRLVGGEEVDIKEYKTKANEMGLGDRIMFEAKIPHSEVVNKMRECDILIAPFPKNEHYSYYMSPLKIFEYMASGRPIVSTRLPSIEEILKPDIHALLVPPGDAKALAEAILDLRSNQELTKKLAINAYAEVKKYTWEKRAEYILSLIRAYLQSHR